MPSRQEQIGLKMPILHNGLDIDQQTIFRDLPIVRPPNTAEQAALQCWRDTSRQPASTYQPSTAHEFPASLPQPHPILQPPTTTTCIFLVLEIAMPSLHHDISLTGGIPTIAFNTFKKACDWLEAQAHILRTECPEDACGVDVRDDSRAWILKSLFWYRQNERSRQESKGGGATYLAKWWAVGRMAFGG